ncbi:GNAT family N-acetyltransferase [Pontibacter harenae]|uniref:GNAT family N-acetyltransferase n=1 Tax=Pontibacter harenae TaxID=2894083 RepID=UPI001E448738|nr:GNAT family N-acetyltransferase [Pontibacter harenae]MCC9165993.1 GNAT family N-acetyltransferase [Pontibacter harenae]
MEKIHFSFLSEKEVPALHDAFMAAFADYVVPIKLNREQFKAKLKREGVEPAFCVAAYAGAEIVGFILTGLGEWEGKPTAYNAGTGVLPAYRGQALTRQMYSFLLPKLRKSGVEQCLLEVIKGNEPALSSYQKVGFTQTRLLDCFRGVKEEILLSKEAFPEGITIVEVASPNWNPYHCFWDAMPTWQNTSQSIKRSIERTVVLEAHVAQQELVGYIAFFPHNGAVVQFAVDQTKRNEGVGTVLLQEAMRLSASASMLFINVDVRSTTLINFLERRHFTKVLQQYEMLLPLD